jgi:hypothetical protein
MRHDQKAVSYHAVVRTRHGGWLAGVSGRDTREPSRGASTLPDSHERKRSPKPFEGEVTCCREDGAP